MSRASPRPCPACGAVTSKCLYRQQFSAIAGASLMPGYDVVVCLGCGAGYADDIPDQETFDAYYRDLSKYEHDHRGGLPSTHYQHIHRQLAGIVESRFPDRQTRFLDVGCANAELLHALQERGYRSLRGVDPSPACSENARRLYDIRVDNASAFRMALEEMFDCVMLTGVLEHVRDLDRLLDGVLARLAPGGELFVVVPDVTNFTNTQNAPFQHFSLEHINFFSPTSLANLMARHGLELASSQQLTLAMGVQAEEPEICAFFRRREAGASVAGVKDVCTETALIAYIEMAKSQQAMEETVLAPLIDTRQPIIVWGVGTQTQRLLAASRLAKANIRAFVDSNPKYHGKSMHGVPVLAPEGLRGRDEAILIVSRAYQAEIERQIRQELRLPNPVILLHRV